MDLLYAIFLFFTGEDYLDLNLPVIVVFQVLLLLSELIKIHSLKQKITGAKQKALNAVWFILKISLGIFIGILSIRFAVSLSIYIILALGLNSRIIARASGKKPWKIIHYLGHILFFILLPVTLIIAGILLRFWVEIIFGAIGIVFFLLFNINIFTKKKLRMVKTRLSIGFMKSSRASKGAFFLGLCLIPLFFISIPYGQMSVEHHMLQMRDGTRLATTIYKPANLFGSLPVIMIRTPYYRDSPLIAGTISSWYMKGYIVITQDVRGTHGSEGVFDGLMSSGYDGYDTCEWVINQPWSNGKIGMIGMSAMGVTQYMATGTSSPGLLAHFADVGCADLYHMYFRGGKWNEEFGFWLWLNSNGSYAVNDEFLAHPNKTSYWENGSIELKNNYTGVNARALHLGGWYDIFAQKTIDAFMGYYYNGTERARRHQKLIMGPFTHGWVASMQGQLSFPNAQDHPVDRWADAIFSESLGPPKLDNSIFEGLTLWDEPNIAYYVIGDIFDADCGANEWRYADDWPLDHQVKELYLQPNLSLSWNPAGSTANLSYIYDPLKPMQTIGGTNLVYDPDLVYNESMVHNVSIGVGIWDQKPLLNRTDVLVFETNTLQEKIEIIGNIKAKLWISSNCTDTDFVVKLMDVYPTGESMLVVDGIVSVRKRNGLDKDELILPGSIYEIEIDLWSTAYQFNAGHKIQALVSSSNAPKYQPCPNTGVPLNRTYSTFEQANNTILISPIYDSRILLPVPV
ncbi:MAG: CocE/NonD family hydrolase [Candidatus Hodarchaeota archaeon]